MREFYFENKGQKIHGCAFEVENPRASLMIIHGISEHIKRYEDFAKFLNEKGISVYGIDLRGHGQSVRSERGLGDFYSYDFLDDIVDDLRRVFESMPRDKARFILGHSMGSFILKYYMASYDDMDGVIFSGTGSLKEVEARGLGLIAKLVCLGGKRKRSQVLNSLLMGRYSRAIKNRKTDLDWLSYNEDNVKSFAEDPYCGKALTNRSYKVFSEAMLKIINEDYKNTRKDLPLGFYSGAEDPVGDFAKGVHQEIKRFKHEGFENIRAKIYDKMRHEILNEREKHVVYYDILNFMEDLI